MERDVEMKPPAIPVPTVAAPAVEQPTLTPKGEYRKSALSGLGRGFSWAVLAYMNLFFYGLPIFIFGSGLWGWPWAFSGAGSVIADVLAASLFTGLVSLQINGAVNRLIGSTWLRWRLPACFVPLALGMISNRWPLLILGLVVTVAAALGVMRQDPRRTADGPVREWTSADRKKRGGYMNRGTASVALLAVGLVAAFSATHPISTWGEWIGGGKPSNVTVNGTTLPKASFFQGFDASGPLHTTLTALKPEGVDPRLVFAYVAYADPYLENSRAEPFKPIKADSNESYSFFVVFGVRGCDTKSNDQLRSTEPFKRVVLEYEVAGHKRSMTFPGAHSPNGFKLCK